MEKSKVYKSYNVEDDDYFCPHCSKTAMDRYICDVCGECECQCTCDCDTE